MVDRIFRAINRQGIEQQFELVSPSVNVEHEGERQYRVAYSKALVEGIFPREKLREIMRDHGMWTEGDDKELKKVVGKIALLQLELHGAEAAGNDNKCKTIASEIAVCRRRMWELFMIQQTVYMNSSEGVAEMIKVEAIMAACTFDKVRNQRYWSTYSEYVQERDFNIKSTVYSQVVHIQAGLLDEARRSLLGDYPEASYLKTPEEAMLDREIQEEVLKTLQTRADVAISKIKKPAKRKRNARSVEAKTNQAE